MNLKPRADLHRHLDGSMRLETISELSQSLNLSVPENLYFKPHMSLTEALSYFTFTLKLLQSTDALTRTAREICEDAYNEGVEKLEIRFGPHLHQQKKLATEEIIEAALAGIDGKAGLILCGLYGDDPKLLKEFVELGKKYKGVVGIDIAGGPHPGHQFKLEDYAEAFTLAKEYGLGRTVHAGEGRPPAEIATAITKLHAQRIGHGVTLMDDPKVLDLVLKNEIVIEACPTSNLQCGVIESYEKHPLGKWLDLGVKACLNTDNTFFSQITSTKEHLQALYIENMNEDKLNLAIENGLKAVF